MIEMTDIPKLMSQAVFSHCKKNKQEVYPKPWLEVCGFFYSLQCLATEWSPQVSSAEQAGTEANGWVAQWCLKANYKNNKTHDKQVSPTTIREYK